MPLTSTRNSARTNGPAAGPSTAASEVQKNNMNSSASAQEDPTGRKAGGLGGGGARSTGRARLQVQPQSQAQRESPPQPTPNSSVKADADPDSDSKSCNLSDFASIVSHRAAVEEEEERSRSGSLGSADGRGGRNDVDEGEMETGEDASSSRARAELKPKPDLDIDIPSTDSKTLPSPTASTSTSANRDREGFGTPRHSALDALAIAAAGVVPGSGVKTRKASASLSAVVAEGGGSGPSGKKRRTNDGSAVQVAVSSETGRTAEETVPNSVESAQQLLPPAVLPSAIMWGDTPLDPTLATGGWANGLLGGTRESSVRSLGALGFDAEAFDPALQEHDQEGSTRSVDEDEGSLRGQQRNAGGYSGMNGQIHNGVPGNSAFASPVSNVSNISHTVPNSAGTTSNGNGNGNNASSSSHRSFKTSTPIIPGRPDNPPPPGHVRSHSLSQYQLQQSSMAGPSSQNSSSSARSGSKANKHRAVGSKTIYTNQATVSATDPNVKYYKPNFTYHELITHEIKRSPEGRLQLSEIYKRISERYPYFKLGEPGWQNSIRHNLSLKKCFVRVDRPTDAVIDKSGKGGWWTYTPGTTEDGRPAGRKGATGKGTGEYRKGSTPSDIASRSPSPGRTIEGEREANEAANSAQTSALFESATMSLAQMSENPSEGMFDYGVEGTDISEMARLVESQQQVDHQEGLGQEMPPFEDQQPFGYAAPFGFEAYSEAYQEGHQ